MSPELDLPLLSAKSPDDAGESGRKIQHLPRVSTGRRWMECPCGNRLATRRQSEFCSGWCARKFRPPREKSSRKRSVPKQRQKTVPATCARCAVSFMASPAQVKAGKGRFCTPSCAWMTTISKRGEQSNNWKGDSVKRDTLYRRNYVARWPERDAARRALQIAVKNGTMVRGKCERCRSTKTQAHHDDYSKPLDVRWLCRDHHYEVHRELRAAGRDPDTRKPTP